MISRRVRELGFSPTLAVADLARRLRAEGRDVLDFSAGEPDFPSPDGVKAAGRKAIDENRTRYTATAGVEELRRAIVEHLDERRGLTYDPGQVLVSPGAKASLYFAFLALCDPGDEVLVPSPYWTSYPEQLRLAGAAPVFLPGEESNGFKLTAAQLDQAATAKTKALILNYPSNPTGVCYSAEELASLAEVCVRRNIWVVADEIYSELLYDGRSFASIAGLGPEIAARTVVIDGMSKTYSMTGWRIGYAAGPQEVITGMAKLQSHSTSNATSVSQWASIAALELPREQLASRVEEFSRRRKEVLRRLNELPGVSCVKPQGAFYVFPNVSGCFDGEIDSGESCARFLLERASVAVVPGEAFGSSEHIRLSYATSLDRISEGMDRIAEALEARAVG
ncbi:MAG: pyridoxal phosphate-dependent aminotransferase [Planctomycetota bacterium]|jgi:aspartate aminotransferase